ncbi:MAG TPA: hypothetical protein VH933_02685 [Aestuariivirgaceae bacterium]|jgi:hypothetical protein
MKASELVCKHGILPQDFLSSISGVGDFEHVRAGAIQIELFGRPCREISVNDLIAAKLALGRDKDLLAARELQAIAEGMRKR